MTSHKQTVARTQAQLNAAVDAIYTSCGDQLMPFRAACLKAPMATVKAYLAAKEAHHAAQDAAIHAGKAFRNTINAFQWTA